MVTQFHSIQLRSPNENVEAKSSKSNAINVNNVNVSPLYRAPIRMGITDKLEYAVDIGMLFTVLVFPLSNTFCVRISIYFKRAPKIIIPCFQKSRAKLLDGASLHQKRSNNYK